ncbi:MAG: tetratricopeptide repeat protein [Candidatus Eremiobacteraeota bacterium]|nr:tetratricopeptide repeat protein [Candidatus Eremiobacteraeota bacterium]MBV8365386.1 tetratricopeptide repeat protein [Candidatus Eremiobacteraeota bacterium]
MRRILIVLCLLACLIAAFANAPVAQAKKGANSSTPAPSVSPTENPLDRIKTLQQTVQDNPNDKDAREELGVLLIENGKPGEGRDQLENAVRLGANDAQLWYFVGVANRELNDMPDAVSAFEKAELADPGNQAVLSSLTEGYLALGRADDAQRIAQRAIALHPTEAFGYVALGTVQLDRGQFDDGRATLNKALAIDPNEARAHLLIGRSYMAGKTPNPDLAIAQFDTVLKTSPDDLDALHSKAEALAMKNDVSGAAAILTTIVKAHPETVEPEDDLAELYLSKNMETQARQEFAAAEKDHPKATEPYVLQAEYDQNQKRFTQSASEFEQALAIAPDDPRILFEYGRLQLQALHNPNKAIDAFNKILAKDPNNADAQFFLGEAYGSQGNWTQARDAFRHAFEITHSAQALYNLAVAFYSLKDYRDARDAFEAIASHQDPKHQDPQIWFFLGDANRMLGDKQSAVAAYKTFLALQPSGDVAAKARGYIKQLSQ